jgi:renal tumor antigen
MEFNFPKKMGTGIKNLIPHATPDCVDLIEQLLKYDPEERITAVAALKHPYFRDLWD